LLPPVTASKTAPEKGGPGGGASLGPPQLVEPAVLVKLTAAHGSIVVGTHNVRRCVTSSVSVPSALSSVIDRAAKRPPVAAWTV
jgi:hypothetical protein